MDGCNGVETEDCSGGKATCTERAVCTVCHVEYGDTLGHNFTIAQHDETHHWNKCSRCDATDTKAVHTGGTATCIDKAECEVCHEKYGEPDANHHIGIEAVDAVPATAASTGTVAHWRCTACGRLFADADGKQEIRSEDTVTKKLAPSILDGANGEWRKGDENGLTFSSDAAFSDFVELLVDGKPVASENYERQEGGIIVELKASYLETLAEGGHTLTIRSTSGDATARFTIGGERFDERLGLDYHWLYCSRNGRNGCRIRCPKEKNSIIRLKRKRRNTHSYKKHPAEKLGAFCFKIQRKESQFEQ